MALEELTAAAQNKTRLAFFRAQRIEKAICPLKRTNSGPHWDKWMAARVELLAAEAAEDAARPSDSRSLAEQVVAMLEG